MILEVQGKRIEVPDGLTEQQIFEVVETASGQLQEPSTLGQRLFSGIERRSQTIQEAQAATRAEEQGAVRGGFQQAGQVASIPFDVGGELISTGFQQLPPQIQDPVRATGRFLGEQVIDPALQLAGQIPLPGTSVTVGDITREAFQDPATVRDIEAITALPALKGVSRLSAIGGRKLVKTAEEQALRIKSDLATDLVKPIQTVKTLEEANIFGNVTEVGLLRTRDIAPTPRQIRAAEIVSDLDVKKNRSFTHNNNVVLKGIDTRAKTLIKELDNLNVIFPKQEVKIRLNAQLNRLVQENPFLVGNSALTAERVRNIVIKPIDDNLSTPAGLLKARKEFDADLKAQTRQASGKTIFDSDQDKAINVAISDIRKVVNDFIAEKAPTVEVKQLLGEQNLLFEARDTLSAKAAREGSNSVKRLFETVSDKIPLKSSVGKTLGVLTVAGVGTGAGLAAPAVVGTGIAGIAGIAAIRGLIRSPNTKKALGELLRASDRVIRLEKDPGVVKQLRADRAIVLELFNEEGGK